MVYYNQMHVKTRLSQPILSKIVGSVGKPETHIFFFGLINLFVKFLLKADNEALQVRLKHAR